jgi:uncharacterized protein YecT (DUF1311 family)
MLRTIIVAGALALLAAPAMADDLDCKNPQDQQSMNFCAEKDYQAADKKLNAVYKNIVTALGDDSYVIKLKTAERAWMTFRDAQCTFETAENEGGSIHPMVYSGCEARLTNERTKELQSYLTCLKDAAKCGR